MQGKKASFGSVALLAIFAVFPFAALTRAAGQTETVLYNFPSPPSGTLGGTEPSSGLIFDAHGNLYGTTEAGGTYGPGTVFKLAPAAGGVWVETAVHSFQPLPSGFDPVGGLVSDAAHNLYGVTLRGGDGAACGGDGCGTVFELTPNANGGWGGKFIHRFTDAGLDGAYPNGGLVLDAVGNLYGTTSQGGKGMCIEEVGGPVQGCGTVFKLSPTSSGGWTQSIVHTFQGTVLGSPGPDGQAPVSGLIFDAEGNLYGTTPVGGEYGYGAVLELLPKVGGGWSEKLLHSFNESATDGYGPSASLVFDTAGYLYGTAPYGGTGLCTDYTGTDVIGCGIVFELSPKVGGSWTEKIIYSFQFNGADGWFPTSSLIVDRAGNLYGTTQFGGAGFCGYEGIDFGCGTVFELSRKGSSGWIETVLHGFQPVAADGQNPNSGLALDAQGNLYGTTIVSGDNSSGGGTVFEIMP
jgi:uncharacterized repeat protein (TIGR03803 family)